MTARYKRTAQVSLLNEEEDDVQEDDVEVRVESAHLIEEEEEERRGREADDLGDEDHSTLLSPGVDLLACWKSGQWKLWKRKRQYHVHPSSKKSRFCRVNSWKAVFIALFAFTIAMVISILLSRLLVEPPLVPSTDAPLVCTIEDGSPTVASGASSATDFPFVGAVSSDVAVCANMSADILCQGGSAVDAAITAMLCNGVVHAESSGIGGGGFMVVRLANGSVYSLNFRETAPSASTWDMFHSNSSEAAKGGLSIAVPGEVKGMEKAHSLFGKLPWKTLFAPVIDLCVNGYQLTEHGVKAFEKEWDTLPSNIRAVYSNPDGTKKKLGEVVQRPVLAKTLEKIANYGSSAFYLDPNISQSIIDTVQSNGGIMEARDLAEYQVKVQQPVNASFNGHTFFTPPAPSGGPTLMFMLKLLDLFHLNSSSDVNLTYHLLVETFKFAYAERTKLGDPNCEDSTDQVCQESRQIILQALTDMFNDSFVREVWSQISYNQTFNVSYYHPDYDQPEDSGTSHISVLSPEGDAVAVTTTVNTYFGANLMTDTGIILNDEMDDFASPNITNSYGLLPSKADFISPGKRPLSSTCPTVAVTNLKDGSSEPYLIVGASGGSIITTAVAQVILLTTVFEDSIEDAIENRRLHHQLVPNAVIYEENFSRGILDFLESIGHTTFQFKLSAVVQGIMVENGVTTAHADSRKHGRSVLIHRN